MGAPEETGAGARTRTKGTSGLEAPVDGKRGDGRILLKAIILHAHTHTQLTN